jgi:signal peptidase I
VSEETAEPAKAEASEASHRKPLAPESTPQTRILGFVFRTVWFLIVPMVLAGLFVKGLTPDVGAEPSGPLAWLQTLMREQPVPLLIASFTLFETAIWFARHTLPLAAFAYIPLPKGAPKILQPQFERARALQSEASVLLERQKNLSESESVSAKDRDAVEKALSELDEAMNAQPFVTGDFVDRLTRAEDVLDERLGRHRKGELREYVESIVIAVGIALVLRQFVAEAFKIPSGSMIPTLQIGDHIFVNKLVYGPTIPFTEKRLYKNLPPERGAVMVFRYPENMEQDFIKRVIAQPGDSLEAKSGHPWINGWEVPNCFVGVYSYMSESQLKDEGDLFVEYLGDQAYVTLYGRGALPPEHEGPFIVKSNEVYVMGDNRHNSHDSRKWNGNQGGGVPFENIKGRAAFVWLSMSDHGVDWGRFGTQVMGRPRLPAGMQNLEPKLSKCLQDRPGSDKTWPPARPPAKPN